MKEHYFREGTEDSDTKRVGVTEREYALYVQLVYVYCGQDDYRGERD